MTRLPELWHPRSVPEIKVKPQDKTNITVRIPETLDRALEMEAARRGMGKGELMTKLLLRDPGVAALVRGMA